VCFGTNKIPQHKPVLWANVSG